MVVELKKNNNINAQLQAVQAINAVVHINTASIRYGPRSDNILVYSYLVHYLKTCT